MSSETVLSLQNITVIKSSVPLLDNVDFDLRKGEIHALVGNHRSGKTNLVGIVSGANRKNSGKIIYKGKEFKYFSPKTALLNGIIMIYQKLNILQPLTVFENIFAGYGKTRRISKKKKQYEEKARSVLKQLNADFEIHKSVRFLSIADQHKIELARLLAFDPEVLIVDEISCRLTPAEMEYVYPILRRFRDEGKSIIYITHNIDEIFELADRVTILNDGKKMGTEKISDIDKIKLINLTYSYVIDREELLHERKEIHYFKNYNETIIQNIPVGVMILDSENNIYMTNFVLRELFDVQDTILISKSIEFLLKNKNLDRKSEILEKIYAHEELLLEDVSFQDSQVLRIAVLPFKDENYIYIGTILIFEDISKENYLKDYMLRMEKLSSIAQLASGVAHEINNPLAIISNYLLLMQGKQLDEDSREKLDKIEKEVNRVVGIVSSLLSFSKLKSIPKEDVELAAIINDVYVLMEHMFKEKQIAFEVKSDAEEYRIIGDENQLKQLFMNLLLNAIDAVQLKGCISISLDMGETFIEILIEDNGSGIPLDLQDKIFDPFFSTKVSKKNAGLGLSICEQVVEVHNGIITCDSIPNESTVFTIRFPVEGS